VDPKLFSPVALVLVNDPRFPRSTDPCGLTQFGGVNNLNEYLTIGRVDYQKSENHSMLVRYMGARKDQPWDYDGKNILSSSQGQVNQRTHTLVFGDTYLIGNGIVNSVHLTAIRTLNPRINPDVIDLNDIGVKNVWVPFKGHMYLTVGSGLAGGIAPNGFSVSGVNVQPGYYNSIEGQASEDVSWIRGAHQFGFGGYYSHMNFTANSNVLLRIRISRSAATAPVRIIRTFPTGPVSRSRTSFWDCRPASAPERRASSIRARPTSASMHRTAGN
jgi:hypothetical protein